MKDDTLLSKKDRIIEKYKNGMSACSIGELYGVSGYIILTRLKSWNITIHSNKYITQRINLLKYQIIEDYESDIPVLQLRYKYNLAESTIRRYLIKWNINIRSRQDDGKRKIIKLPMDEIIEDYKNGMNPKEIGKKHNIGYETIRKNLKEFGVQMRTSSEASTNKVCLPKEDIMKDYKNGMSQSEISRKYNIGHCTIGTYLRKWNVIIRDRSEASKLIDDIEVICVICNDKFMGKSGCSIYCPNCKPDKYCHLFNLPLKEAIRLYFDNKCFMDNEPEENDRLTSVHHVGYDKRCGCDATQFCIFVPVKAKWNAKFNGSKEYNRWYWYTFLMNKIFIEHPNYFAYHIPVWGMDELKYNYNYVFEKFRRR